MPKKIFVFIRTDISEEQQIVQTGHVCYEAGKEFSLPPHLHLVLCSAKNQDDLMRQGLWLDIHGIKYKIFHEPDCGIGYSSICTEPLEDVSKMKRFKLLIKRSKQNESWGTY